MITIRNVTPQQFGQLEEKLAARHDAVLTPKPQVSGSLTEIGTITGHGVIAGYCYVLATQTLTVEVAKHPFYISEGAIEANIRKALEL
jgi:hypothetical protein